MGFKAETVAQQALGQDIANAISDAQDAGVTVTASIMIPALVIGVLLRAGIEDEDRAKALSDVLKAIEAMARGETFSGLGCKITAVRKNMN